MRRKTFNLFLPLSEAPVLPEQRVEDGLLKGAETILTH